MLRGKYTITVDDKGRIKLPSTYRRYVFERYGAELYVTSLTGEYVLLYPLQEWLKIEDTLRAKGTSDPSVRKFLDRTNYFGHLARMDKQGRILINPLLRSSAQLWGEVAVIGYLQYLEVWSELSFKARIDREPFTDEDIRRISQLGI